jgi:hypothetical protein
VRAPRPSILDRDPGSCLQASVVVAETSQAHTPAWFKDGIRQNQAERSHLIINQPMLRSMVESKVV